MPEKLNREELIDLVTKIIDADGTEEEVSDWIDLFQDNVPYPGASDLIFWPKDNRRVTPEEVVDEALAYRPPPAE